MKNTILAILTIIMFGCASLGLITENASALGGTIYYVDYTAGSDANPGTSPTQAWQTIAKVNAAALQPGDSVLFKRGCIWRERLIAKSGNSTGYVTYAAYGEGDKPIIALSKQENSTTDWTYYGNNLWINNDSAFNVDVGNIIFNNGELCGQKRNSLAKVTAQGDFIYDFANDRIALYSTTNPASFYSNIECALNTSSIILSNSQYVIIENLDIRYTARHGISCENVQNIIIRNNDFSFIGGGDQNNDYGIRLGNAIQFWNSNRDCSVYGNRIDQVYDAGITSQGSGVSEVRNLKIYNNIVTKCEYAFEYFYSNSASIVDGVYVVNNTFALSGGGWGHFQRWDGRNGTLLELSTNNATTGNFYIQNNILYKATERPITVIRMEDANDFIVDYNCIYVDNMDKIAPQLATWQGLGQDLHSILKDPLLDENYKPTAESPVRDAGITLLDITDDYAGNKRPDADKYDIGAYEFINKVVFIFNGTGNWSDASLWSGGKVPVADSAVVINGACILNAAVADIGTLTINKGGLLNLAGYNLSVKNDIINNGTLYLYGNELIAGAITNGPLSMVEYTGALSYTGLAAGNSYYNLCFSGKGKWILSNDVNIEADMTIKTGNTLNASGKNIVLAGNYTNSGTFIHGNGTMVFNGNTIIGGYSTNAFYNVTINSGKSLTAPSAGTIYLMGDWMNNGTFSNNSVTIALNGSGLQQIKTGGSGSGFNIMSVNNISAAGILFKDALYASVLNIAASVKKLSFATGQAIVHTITKSISFQASKNNLLLLAPETAGQTWYLNAPGGNVRYVNVSYSSQTDGKIINAYNSTNGGNNKNWRFR